jgi:uncharacterized protein YcsI (UPF0317 family)
MPFQTGVAVRLACRNGDFPRSTAGHAPGYVQGSLTILPEDLAADFTPGRMLLTDLENTQPTVPAKP